MRKAKQLGVAEINTRWSPFSSHLLHSCPVLTAYKTSGLSSWGIDRDSLRHPSQVDMNNNISRATRGKLNAPDIVPRWELIPCLWLKIWAKFPPAPQMEFSLSSRYVRGSLCFLSQVECTPRDPYSKQGRTSLQWLKFSLLLHPRRWRDVWIPCGNPRESHSSPPHLHIGNHVTLISREAHGIQSFKRWRCLTLFENG